MKIYEKPMLNTLSIAQEQGIAYFGTPIQDFIGSTFEAITSYARNSGTAVTGGLQGLE